MYRIQFSQFANSFSRAVLCRRSMKYSSLIGEGFAAIRVCRLIDRKCVDETRIRLKSRVFKWHRQIVFVHLDERGEISRVDNLTCHLEIDHIHHYARDFAPPCILYTDLICWNNYLTSMIRLKIYSLLFSN